MSTLNTKPLLTALTSAAKSDDKVHFAVCDLMEQVSTMSKKQIVESADLERVMKHPVMARQYARQIVAMIHEYTPVRFKFKGNGQFEKIGFSAAHAKKETVWDITAMRDDRWYQFEAVSTKKVSKGDIESALRTLAVAVARVGHEKNNLGIAFDLAREGMGGVKFNEMVREYMDSERFAEWAEKFDNQRDLAKTTSNVANIKAA
jgi:hypothetical protein